LPGSAALPRAACAEPCSVPAVCFDMCPRSLLRPSSGFSLLVLWCGCGFQPDPQADRRTLADFLNAPARSSADAAALAAGRLAALPQEQLTPADRLQLANFFDLQNQPEQAIGQLQKIPDQDKNAAQARLGEGRLHLARTRRAALAELQLKKAVELAPNNALGWAQLSNLYDIQNRIELRNACYLKLDELSGLNRDQLLLWTSDRRPDAVQRDIGRILQLFVNADPADTISALALGEDRRRRGELDAAGNAINPFTADLNSPAFAILESEIMMDQGDAAKAQTVLNQIKPADIKQNDILLKYHRQMGRVQFGLKQWANAEESLKNAVANHQHDRESYQLLIQILKLQKRPADAAVYETQLKRMDHLEDLAQKAMATLHRDDPAWLEQVAAAAAELGRFDVARAWLRQILARDPLNQKIQAAIFQMTERLKNAAR